MKKYKYQFRLKKGFVIKIDGIPYEYLGKGMVGSNTDLGKIYADRKKRSADTK